MSLSSHERKELFDETVEEMEAWKKAQELAKAYNPEIELEGVRQGGEDAMQQHRDMVAAQTAKAERPVKVP